MCCEIVGDRVGNVECSSNTHSPAVCCQRLVGRGVDEYSSAVGVRVYGFRNRCATDWSSSLWSLAASGAIPKKSSSRSFVPAGAEFKKSSIKSSTDMSPIMLTCDCVLGKCLVGSRRYSFLEADGLSPPCPLATTSSTILSPIISSCIGLDGFSCDLPDWASDWSKNSRSTVVSAKPPERCW